MHGNGVHGAHRKVELFLIFRLLAIAYTTPSRQIPHSVSTSFQPAYIPPSSHIRHKPHVRPMSHAFFEEFYFSVCRRRVSCECKSLIRSKGSRPNVQPFHFHASAILTTTPTTRTLRPLAHPPPRPRPNPFALQRLTLHSRLPGYSPVGRFILNRWHVGRVVHSLEVVRGLGLGWICGLRR